VKLAELLLSSEFTGIYESKQSKSIAANYFFCLVSLLFIIWIKCRELNLVRKQFIFPLPNATPAEILFCIPTFDGNHKKANPSPG
jgi:hypothetical protein